MKMKLILVGILVSVGNIVSAQTIWTLRSCQEKAQANYPAIKQYDLIRKSGEYTLSNAGKAYLPQLSLSGKASYQTDVTKIQVDIPGIKGLSKDQYSMTVEVTQSVWDGGATHARKQIERGSSDVSKNQLDVDMYVLYDRVNQLYFSVLLMEAKLVQNRLLQEEFQRNYDRVKSAFQNGMAHAADLDAVRVEQLKAIQQETQVTTARAAYLEMLAHLTGQDIPISLTLQRPEEPEAFPAEINRPELKLVDARQELLRTQLEAIKVGYMPRIGLFVTGGYGRPGLNMLNPDFSLYALGGIRLSWNFGSLYTAKNERRILEADIQTAEVQRETFLFNTHMDLKREEQEVRKNKDLLKYDDDIIRLRANVKEAAEAQVNQGTLTVTEWMQKVTDEDLAHQEKIQHEIEYLLSVYNRKYTMNQ